MIYYTSSNICGNSTSQFWKFLEVSWVCIVYVFFYQEDETKIVEKEHKTVLFSETESINSTPVILNTQDELYSSKPVYDNPLFEWDESDEITFQDDRVDSSDREVDILPFLYPVEEHKFPGIVSENSAVLKRHNIDTIQEEIEFSDFKDEQFFSNSSTPQKTSAEYTSQESDFSDYSEVDRIHGTISSGSNNLDQFQWYISPKKEKQTIYDSSPESIQKYKEVRFENLI